MQCLAEQLRERGTQLKKSILRWRRSDGHLMLEAAAEIEQLRSQSADLAEQYASAMESAGDLAKMVGIKHEAEDTE